MCDSVYKGVFLNLFSNFEIEIVFADLGPFFQINQESDCVNQSSKMATRFH